MRRLVLLVVLVAAGIAGCGDDDGSSGVAPPAPYGLSSVTLPDTDGEMIDVFAAMPSEISGLLRVPDPDYGLALQYGDLSTIVAFPFGDEAVTLAEDLARFRSEPGASVEGSQLDEGKGLVWVQGSFTDDGGAALVHLLVWGSPDSDWVFNVSAESPAMREAITRAFVEAVTSVG
jgi:hypothetical protein